jgi:hypothetical protein
VGAGVEGGLALEPQHRPAVALLAGRVAVRPLWTTAGPVRETAVSAELRVPLVEALRLPAGRAPTTAAVLVLSASASTRAPAPRLALLLSLE